MIIDKGRWMPKHKTLIKEIPMSPYSVDLWLIISSDPSEAVTKFNHSHPNLAIKWTNDMAAWTEDKFYKDSFLTVIFHASFTDANTVSHEAVHIKNRIFEHAGILHDPKNDEPEAYLLGWIVQKITEAINEYRKGDRSTKAK